jgi:hypothetical protein
MWLTENFLKKKNQAIDLEKNKKSGIWIWKKSGIGINARLNSITRNKTFLKKSPAIDLEK